MLNLTSFEPRLNRSIEQGDLVGVHWNLRKNTWSIVAMKSRKSVGLVVGYANAIILENVTFHIDKIKQASVREKGAKDRHAFVVGKIVDLNINEKLTMELYYNPFKVDSFVDKTNYNNGRCEYLTNVKTATFFYDGKPIVKYTI
ncbi:hypothetical protein ABD87_22890 [Lysinibacillus sphaericus]|uniref:hypothetical protein n=1 Tax=Lysinibacillus sphaericus TaxID=1421 RepID=UPI0018CFE00F|nr:hypothetical protein [Lysinibacillus sphaericus]MBG9732275.1 hypothetical protein [Lysinibacillus sphaericus]